MTGKLSFKTRLIVTTITTIAIWLLLCWNHFHGGVISHHILTRKDLPAISNWWGGLVIPLLTWLLLHRIQQRLIRNKKEQLSHAAFPVTIWYGFAAALLFGVVLSAFFTLGNRDMPGYVMMGLLLSALFLPVCRSECLLGFVIGMTYTFGAVLPTILGSILVLISAVLFLYVRPGILYILSKLKQFTARNKS